MQLIPLKKFGCIVTEFNLKNNNEKEIFLIKNALHTYKLIIIKNQHPCAELLIQFAKVFGNIHIFPLKEYHHPKYPEILVISNINKNGEPFRINHVGNFWHSDSSYLKTPLHITMLLSIVLPESGGHTLFADMEFPLYSMSQSEKQQIIGKLGKHEIKWRYKPTLEDIGKSIYEIQESIESKYPPVFHPVVIRHPLTSKELLYVNPGYTSSIAEINFEEIKYTLKTLFNKSLDNRNIYKHKWEKGDLLLWDNRSLIHMATPFPSDQRRMMFRIGINEAVSFYL